MDRYPNKTILNQLFPARCVLCRQSSDNHTSLCDYCFADLTLFDYQQFDNLMLRPDINRGIKQPQFDRLISVAPYQWPWNQWVGDMKFRERFAMATLMGNQLTQCLQSLIEANPALKPDVILPMPIHRNRRFSRGYNQAYLLGKVLSEKLDIGLNNKALSRVKSTKAQSELGKSARKKNIKNAFAYQVQSRGKRQAEAYHHVALIDDVITTGATVNEACKVLRAQGVAVISVWTVCATPLSK